MATWHSAVASLAVLLRKDLVTQQQDRARRFVQSQREHERTQAQSAHGEDNFHPSESSSKLGTRQRSRGSADLHIVPYRWPLRAPDGANEHILEVQLSQPALHFAFIHAVGLLGNVNRIPDPLRSFASPNVHHRAMLAVSHLSAILLGDADQTGRHSRLGSQARRDRLVDPHINTILRIVGSWLLDSALNPHPQYAKGRAVALVALGELFCTPRRHGGREPVPLLGDVSALLRGQGMHEVRRQTHVAASAKPLTPHTVRYILTLRAALSTEHGTPETVIAVLRASHGILGAGLNGSRCLLKELNLACHNLLLGDETSRLSPAVNRDAGAFSFFTKPLPHPQADDASGGVNASETKFEGAVASPATGTEVVTALYCAAFPVHGWLGERLGLVESAPTMELRDTSMQRAWISQVLVTECCLPTHFAASREAFAASTEGKQKWTLDKNMGATILAAGGRSGMKTPRQDRTMATVDTYKSLRTDLVSMATLAIIAAHHAGARDRANIKTLICLFTVLIHDAAVATTAPTLLLSSSGSIMRALESAIAVPFLEDRLWPFPGTAAKAFRGSSVQPPSRADTKQQSPAGSLDSTASGGGDIVGDVDVDIPRCIILMLNSIRLHADLFKDTCRSTCRRLLVYLTRFCSRLAVWHQRSLATDSYFDWSNRRQSTAATSSPTRQPPTSPASWLEELDKMVDIQRSRFELGAGLNYSGGEKFLRSLSPAAAEVLGAGLECLRLWTLEASWAVRTPPFEHENAEALEASVLSSKLTTTAIMCGAFVAPPSSLAPAQEMTVALYLRGLPPHAARVGALATQLLETLDRQAGSFPMGGASLVSSRVGRELSTLNAISSLVTERSALAAHENDLVQARRQRCRYLLVNGTTVLTIIEPSPTPREGNSAIVIARDGSSRSSWKVNCVDLMNSTRHPPELAGANDGRLIIGALERCMQPTPLPFTQDPLLRIIQRNRRLLSAPQPQRADSPPEALEEEGALLRCMLPLPQEGDKDEGCFGKKYARTTFLPVKPPMAHALNVGSRSHMQHTRLIVAAILGATCQDNFKTVQILDGSDDVVCKLDAIDTLPERECHVIWCAFARNLPNISSSRDMNRQPAVPDIEIVGHHAYDGVEGNARRQVSDDIQASLPLDWHFFLTGEDPIASAVWSPTKREPILGASCRGLGAAIDPSRHQGFRGGVDLRSAAHDQSPLLYWSDARDELVIYDTTRPLMVRPGLDAGVAASSILASGALFSSSEKLNPFDYQDEDSVRKCILEFEHPIKASDSVNTPETRRAANPGDAGGRVLVLWNEAVQQPCPHSPEWDEFGLGRGGEDLVIIIEPIEDGLYRTRLYDTSPSPAQGMPASLFSRFDTLGPLTHGMVVSRRLLGPLVRQTALNARRILAEAKRRSQFSQGTAASRANDSPENLKIEGAGELPRNNWQYGYLDGNERWSCPFDGRSRMIETLRRHARLEHNQTLGTFLRTVVAPPENLLN